MPDGYPYGLAPIALAMTTTGIALIAAVVTAGVVAIDHLTRRHT